MGLTAEELAILKVGRELGIKSIVTGEFHLELFEAARGHAAYMARANKQGHQGFDKRFRELSAILGGRYPTEICAETWGHEDTPEEIAREFFHSWSQSPGHWAAANGECDFFGYSCEYGRRVCYACGLVVKKNDRQEQYGAVEWAK